MFSIIVITHNRKEEVLICLEKILSIKSKIKFELILLDNGSAHKLEIKENLLKDPKLKLLSSKQNLGVSGGRNFCIQYAKFKYLIFIDDDAYFKSDDFLKIIKKNIDDFKSYKIHAFQIIDYYTNSIDKKMYPFSSKKNINNPLIRETSSFIGAGFILEKGIIKKIGLFDDFFPYGSEELDYAFRALNNEYKILYTPNLQIIHKPSKFGRLPGNKFKEIKFFNRFKAIYLNLPLKYVLSHLLIRSCQFLLVNRFNLFLLSKIYIKIIKYIFREKKNRRVISNNTIIKIKKLKGFLYF